MKRREIVRTTTAITAALMLTPAVAQPDINSANYRMQGCRDFVNQSSGDFDAGICVGIMNALIFVGIPLGICKPTQATIGEAIRVVVQYIDARPARLHEDFDMLAIEALRKAWPCQK
jgi:hypothetical protein